MRETESVEHKSDESEDKFGAEEWCLKEIETAEVPEAAYLPRLLC